MGQHNTHMAISMLPPAYTAAYTRLADSPDTFEASGTSVAAAPALHETLPLEPASLLESVREQTALYRECQCAAQDRELVGALRDRLQQTQAHLQRLISTTDDTAALMPLLSANQTIHDLLATSSASKTAVNTVPAAPALRQPVLSGMIAQCTNPATGSCRQCGEWIKTEVTKSGGWGNWGHRHILHRCPCCRTVIANTRGTLHTEGPGRGVGGGEFHFG